MNRRWKGRVVAVGQWKPEAMTPGAITMGWDEMVLLDRGPSKAWTAGLTNKHQPDQAVQTPQMLAT